MTKQSYKERVNGLVEEIMQSGFDVAMGGTPFKSEEENKADQEKAYDEAIIKNAQAINSLLLDTAMEARIDEVKKIMSKFVRGNPLSWEHKMFDERLAQLEGELNEK